ncbi:complement component receptor 1-like protein isoform X1 [Arapaima gigas]
MLICVLVASVKAQCSRPELLGNVELSSEDLSKSDFPEGSTVSFQCSLGYVTESGNRRITCTNGVWSELRLKCMKKPCGSPGEVLNGMFDFSDGTDYGAIVRISCNKGYTLVGKDSILCTENGWDERLPTCDVVKCEDPPQIKDGKIVWRPDKEFPHYNDVIQYQCNSGYIFKGPSEIVCGADGEYNSPPPQCVVPPCKTPADSKGAVLTSADSGKSDFPDGSSVTFECALGYENKGGSGKISCSSGTWSRPTLNCEKISCGSPGDILNGMFDLSKGTDYGAIVRIFCNKGYTLVGKDSILCTENGWNERLPTCDAVKCEDPPQIKDGRIVWRPDREFPHYNDVIQYQCNSGYILSGPSEIVCGADGEYNSPPPRCEGK